MRQILLFVLSYFAFVRPIMAAEANPSWRLSGIVVVNDPELPPIKAALIEIFGPRASEPLLREGEVKGNCLVERIYPEAGRVSVRDVQKQQALELTIEPSVAAPDQAPTFQFRSATLLAVIDLLQTISGRTIPTPPRARMMRLDLTSARLSSRREGAATLERALLANGFIHQLQSVKLGVLVLNSETNLLGSIPKRSSIQQSTTDIIPPGLIQFTETEVRQVLDFYQELTGRTVIQPTDLMGKITMRTQTALTREEGGWTLDVALRLAGVVMIGETDKFIFAVPVSKTNGVPRFNRQSLPPKAVKTPTSSPGFVKFADSDAQVALELYASLLGRETVPPAPKVRLTLSRPFMRSKAWPG